MPLPRERKAILTRVLLSLCFVNRSAGHWPPWQERRPAWVLRFYARFAFEPFNAALDMLVDLLTAATRLCQRACGCACGCGPRIVPTGIDVPHHVSDTGAKPPSSSSQAGTHAGVLVAGAVAAAAQGDAATDEDDAHSTASGDAGGAPSIAASGSGGGGAPASSASTAASDAEAEAAAEIAEQMESELENAVAARVQRAVGVAGIYATWAVLTWFIFAYGKLAFDQLGAAAEQSFLRSWLVALGVDNASQWRDVLYEVLKGALLLSLLDRLWLLHNVAWLEDHVDVLSVHATLLASGAVTRWQRISAHLHFFAAVEDGE
jgi:hypothetical protein